MFKSFESSKSELPKVSRRVEVKRCRSGTESKNPHFPAADQKLFQQIKTTTVKVLESETQELLSEGGT